MTNGGDAPLTDLLSGQTLWPNAGYFFGVPGLGGLQEGSDRSAVRPRHRLRRGLEHHAPCALPELIGSRSKDLFLRHTLPAGESRTFDAWLQVGRAATWPGRRGRDRAQPTAGGHVTGSRPGPRRQAVREPGGHGEAGPPTPGSSARTVVTTCHCRLATIRCTRQAGHSQSKPTAVKSPRAGDDADFGDLEPPGQVDFTVVDARTARHWMRASASPGQRNWSDTSAATRSSPNSSKGPAASLAGARHYGFRSRPAADSSVPTRR